MMGIADRARAPSIAGAVLLLAAAGIGGQGPPTVASPAERQAVERSILLRDAGRPADAARALEDFLGGRPASPAALWLLIDLKAQAGDPASALPWVERAVAEGTGDPHVKRAWVVSLVNAGFTDSARAVARRWVRGSPGRADAHLALMEAELAGADTSAAIGILEKARGTVEEPGRVLERLADLYIVSGSRDGLLRTWEALLSFGEPGIVAVVEDARSGSRPRSISDELWLALRSRSTRESMQNGAYAALRLGTPEAARQLARGAQPAGTADRSRYLRGYASEATSAGLPGEAAWAADELARQSTRPADRQRWQSLSADMALVAGDTVAARQTFRVLLDEVEPGEPSHRLASRRLFSILASSPRDLPEAAALWDSYRVTYPDSARELARMAGELSEGRARADALQEAERGLREARATLTSVDARAAIDAAAARLSLYRSEPDSALARLARATAEPGTDAAAHTRNLRTLAVLEGAHALELEVLGEALLRMRQGQAEWGPAETLARLEAVPASASRPAMLSLIAAELDAAGYGEWSSTILEQLTVGFPESPQAPDALLHLARRAISTRPAAARAWLERLIIAYPESALAPLARRLLAELDAAGPRSRGG